MKKRFLFQQDTRFLVQSAVCTPEAYRAGYRRALAWQQRIHHPHMDPSFLQALRLPFENSSSAAATVHPWLHKAEGAVSSPLLASDPCATDVRLIIVMAPRAWTRAVQAMASVIQSWVWIQGSRARLCFVHDANPDTFWEVMSIADPQTTAVIAYGPTGDDEEVALPLMRCLEYWHELVPPALLAQRIAVVTSRPASTLADIARLRQLTCDIWPPHGDPDALCFHPAWQWPLQRMGFDTQKFYQGARHVCLQFFHRTLKAPLEYTAFCHGMRVTGDTPLTIMPHALCTSHAPLTSWMSAVSALWVPQPPESSRRRMLSVLHEHHGPREQLNPQLWESIPRLQEMARRCLLDSFHQRQHAFCAQAAACGQGVRVLNIQTLNEETLGALMMNHLLESLLLRGCL